jgi:hypothetical protein
MLFMFVNWTVRSVLLSAVVVAGSLSVLAADKKTAAKPERETVELFAAIKSGDVEVRLIPKDAKEATVIVTNKTKKPLSVKMPEAFAGVPVLAQQGFGNQGNQGGFGGNQGGFGGGGGFQQSFGGGFGGGGFGGGGFGGGGFGGGGQFGGGGFFNVEPEKAKKVKVATVCLEHGKKDPHPNIKYTIKPIESFTKKQDVIEVCKMLGRGELDQVSAQAAAWHLANDISWVQLANKIGVKHINGSVEPFFQPRHIDLAMRAAKAAEFRAEKLRTEKESEKSDSISRTSLRD